ncbi:hypothetical protein [Agromyces sp. H66]|uniref:DUF6998 domain-containing protein n=1 Tax=Agromyces sp. H66 TaxID=2529859 RepID=UPI0010AB0B24|nr:hypothetical protein [Agromyces sp. H66]
MDISEAPLQAVLAQRAELLAQVKALTSELRRRGIARTDNFIGEIGERLALDVYGGELESPSAKDIDLIDGRSRRIQVKVRELPAGDLRRYTFASLDFDVAICIRFDRATYAIDWAREISAAEIAELSQAYRAELRLSGSRARSAGVDVTESFRNAWSKLQRQFA